MFQHLCVILREFKNLYSLELHKLFKLKILKLQFLKTVIFKYYLVVVGWYNIVCATLQYLLKAVCLCGCIYNPLLHLHVCLSGLYRVGVRIGLYDVWTQYTLDQHTKFSNKG
jgi:hypothetical protein